MKKLQRDQMEENKNHQNRSIFLNVIFEHKKKVQFVSNYITSFFRSCLNIAVSNTKKKTNLKEKI